MVPTPAGPVPVPLPHPFIGVVFDPIGEALNAAVGAVLGGGGTVLINGMPAASTGTEVKGFPHTPTPPGVAPAPNDIPSNEGTLVTGSKTVRFAGSSQGRTGSIVMSCGSPTSLPTSVCVAVPMGSPVLIGGPEAADFGAAVTRGIRTKWVSSKLHTLTGATKGSFRSKLICFLTGHPVDVMTGELIAEAIDFELPGTIPIVWERNYRSRQTDEGALGPGWSHPFEESIEETPAGLVLRLADGRPKEHPRLAMGGSDWDGEDRYTLTRTLGGYEKRGADGVRTMFAKPEGARRLMPTRIIDRSGNAIILKYHGAYLMTIQDTAGRTLGLVDKVMDPMGAVTEYTWDPYCRKTSETDGLGNKTEWVYDARGNCVLERDPFGNETRWAYDRDDQPVHKIDAAGGEWAAAYDLRGKPIWVRDPMGSVTWLTHDDHGRLIGVDGDKAGRTARVLGPDYRVTQIERDALGRIVKRTLSAPLAGEATLEETFAYGPLGELVAAVSGEVKLVFERDALGRVVRERCEIAGEGHEGHEVESRYDGAGRRIERQTDLGHRLEYSWDKTGELIGLRAGPSTRLLSPALVSLKLPLLQMPDWEMKIARGPLGLELVRRMPGGVVAIWKYDGFGKPALRHVLTGAREPNPGTDVLRVGYRWSAAEQIAALIDTQKGPTRFAHDPRGHLIAAIFADGTTQHRQSDAVGNVFRTADRSDRRYGSGGVLRHVGAIELLYDGLGSLIEKRLEDGTSWRYRWDAAGRLKEVVRPDGKTVAFLYDALGRRVRKEFDGIRTDYIWDGDDLVHERVRRPDGLLDPLITWIFEPGTFAPVAKLVGRKRYSIVNDHLGTPMLLMTEAGQVAWKAQLDLYGVPREELGAKRIACPWRYPGQYEDAETGLYYNRFRYYDPESGRYISQDPLRVHGASNLYRYVTSPLARMDPYGLIDPWDIRFTQPTISARFRQGPWAGRTLAEAIGEARQLGDLPEGLQLNIIKINDDYFTLNNRTLYVAQHANLSQVHPNNAGKSGTNRYERLVKDGGPLDLGEQPKVCK